MLGFLLAYWLARAPALDGAGTAASDFVKPDHLIKRRGKAGFLALNKSWDGARQWIADRAGKPQKVCIYSLVIESVTGTLISS